MKKVCGMLTALALIAGLSLNSFAVTLPVDPADLTEEQVAALLPEDGNGFLKSETLSDCKNSNAVTDGNQASAASVLVGDSVAVNFGGLLSINFMDLFEVGHNLRGYRLDAWNGAEWVRIYQNDLANGYYGATFDTVRTSAVRLTVTSLASATAAAIGEMSFTYQPPVQTDHEVLNVGYVTPSTYYHKWDTQLYNGKGKELFTRFTDIVFTDLFLFDETGGFNLQIQNRGMGEDELFRIDALTGSATLQGEPITADGLVREWQQLIRDSAGTTEDPARYWFHLRYAGGQSNTQAFLDPAVCEKLVDRVVTFCKRHGFAGVDIGWTPTTPDGWASFDRLVSALADRLHREGLKLSSRQLSTTGLSDASLQKLDYLHVIAYDRSDRNDSEGNHHSTYHYTVEQIDRFLARGVEAKRLVLGNAWHADALTGIMGTSWKSVYSSLQEAAGGQAVDPGQNFLYTGTGNWSYSGPYLTADKTAYVLRRGLGGIFCPDVSQDITDKNSAYSLSYQTDRTLRRFTAQVQP